jgi:hypothetical protein
MEDRILSISITIRGSNRIVESYRGIGKDVLELNREVKRIVCG